MVSFRKMAFSLALSSAWIGAGYLKMVWCRQVSTGVSVVISEGRHTWIVLSAAHIDKDCAQSYRSPK